MDVKTIKSLNFQGCGGTCVHVKGGVIHLDRIRLKLFNRSDALHWNQMRLANGKEELRAVLE